MPIPVKDWTKIFRLRINAATRFADSLDFANHLFTGVTVFQINVK